MIKGNVTRAGLTKVLAVVFLVLGLGCLYGGNYAHGYVSDQLRQEKISMPTQKGIDALKDDAAASALKPYIGQEMTTGPQAQAFANNYLWHHMMASSQGKTYEEVSGEFMGKCCPGRGCQDRHGYPGVPDARPDASDPLHG